MARKTTTTARKPAARKATPATPKPAPDEAAHAQTQKAAPATPAPAPDTKGVAGTAQPDQSPIAPPADAAVATGGGEDTSPAGDETPTGSRIAVVCHRKDGRRRVSRRWPQGETIVAADALSDFQIAQLEADPQFTITHLTD